MTHSTTLIPAGLFKQVEDEPREIEEVTPEGDDETEVKKPTTLQMTEAKMWCHANKNILQGAGRTEHLEPVEPEDPPEDYDIDEEKKK